MRMELPSEGSSDSDSYYENTSLREFFLQLSSTSESNINFNNINMSNGTGSATKASNLAEAAIQKIIRP